MERILYGLGEVHLGLERVLAALPNMREDSTTQRMLAAVGWAGALLHNFATLVRRGHW